MPPEIITYIFRLVVGSRSCTVHDRYASSRSFEIELPLYQDLLSHVCFLWRSLVLGTPILWTHIGLAPFHKDSDFIDYRAHVMAKRASSRPLDVCIVKEFSRNDYSFDRLGAFLDSAATQIRGVTCNVAVQPCSILLLASLTHSNIIIDAFFTRCVPGTITRLAIINALQGPVLLMPIKTPSGITSSPSELSYICTEWDVVEALLLPIRVLQLTNVRFAWESAAYHNLVELHLLNSGGPGSERFARLTESNLVGILTSSPGLRVLHLGLELDTSSRVSEPPVELPCLEVLCFPRMARCEASPITRLINPGSLSLEFSVGSHCYHDQPTQFCDDEMLKFFARANIAKLQVTGCRVIDCTCGGNLVSSVQRILEPLPKLRELTLGDFGWNRRVCEDPAWDEFDSRLSGPHVDALYILESVIFLGHLLQMIQRYKVKSIVIWKDLVRGVRVGPGNPSLELALTDVCPAVKVISEGPSPVSDWS